MLHSIDMWTQKSFEHALYQVHYGSESVLISTVASKLFTFFPPEWPAQWRNKEKRKMFIKMKCVQLQYIKKEANTQLRKMEI